MRNPTSNPTLDPPSEPAPHPHHRLNLNANLGALHLEINLPLTRNWTIIFGPSGSGKSSILRAVAGLLPAPDARLLRFGDPQNSDRSPQDLTPLPPRARHIAYAPQQPSLFPHLTVAANVAFAQQSHKQSTASQQTVNTALQLFRLQDLALRYPRNLSGGEQQRVNLARAFAVPNPRLMLLDEPFTGIDRSLRDAILPELRSSLRLSDIPVLSVTHDVEEAFLLDAEVVLLDAGRIHDQGHVSRVLSAERSSILDALR